MGHDITERGTRYRLQKLENDNVILGCSAILNPNLVSERLNRTITLRFKYSNLVTLVISAYRKTKELCTRGTSARVSGGDFDWISHFVFQSLEKYELKSSNFLNRFADLIADYRSYESNAVKASPYNI
jgi:DNA-binding Lrp family transcriptional regulator